MSKVVFMIDGWFMRKQQKEFVNTDCNSSEVKDDKTI